MLVIRKEQIQTFITPDPNDLIVVVGEAIRAANGERVSDYEDKEFAPMLEIGIARACSWGLSGAEDIAAFIALMFEIAPRFDEQPEIQEVLKDERFPADKRLYQLFQRVPDVAWASAEKLYDDVFWFPDKV